MYFITFWTQHQEKMEKIFSSVLNSVFNEPKRLEFKFSVIFFSCFYNSQYPGEILSKVEIFSNLDPIPVYSFLSWHITNN